MVLDCRVKLGQDTRSGDFFAIKIVKQHHVPPHQLETFKRVMNNEVRLLKSLDHPNIIRLIEYNTESGELI
jgi:serine/threonine protein kinase